MSHREMGRTARIQRYVLAVLISVVLAVVIVAVALFIIGVVVTS